MEVGPVEMTLHTTEAPFPNQYRYFELAIPENGSFSVDIPYHVARDEAVSALGNDEMLLDDEARAHLLAATDLVPTTGKPLRAAQGHPACR